jgi:hypothetical protein
MSGKNHTTSYSQVRWEMIWHFALCVVPTSVLLQGDCMILKDTLRPVYTRKQSLLLTKPPNMRSDLNNDTICCLTCAKQNQEKAINRRVNNKFVYNECVFMYHFTSLLYYHSTTRYNFVCLKATLKIPLRRVGRGKISPLAVPRG